MVQRWCRDGAKLCLIFHLANWQMNRRKLCTIILSMNNDCEFVSARFFWKNSSTFLNSKIKQRWLTHIIALMNKALHHQWPSPWITTLNLSVTRFFLMYSSTSLNSEIKQRWLTHIIVIKIVNTRYKILHCRKQKIYLISQCILHDRE